nr:hypothetical protein [Tanacetum cinerariifolium]
MPPKPDLVFNTAPTTVKTGHLAFNVHHSPTKPEQDLSHTTRPTAPIIEDWVSDSEDESKTKASQIVPSFIQSFEQVKTPSHYVQPVETYILAATPTLSSPKSSSSGKRKNRKACFVCKSVDHLIKDCDYYTKKMAQPTPKNNAHRGNHKQYASLTHTNPPKHMVPTAVLTQSKPVFNTVVRPVSADMPKINVTRPRYAHPIVTKFKSPIRRHITCSLSPNTSNSPPRVTVVQASVISAAEEEEPANYALIAFLSLSSSSDNEVPSCSKACSKAYAQLHSQYDKLIADFRKFQFYVISNQTALDSVEARVLVYKQNESIFEENIKLLNIEAFTRAMFDCDDYLSSESDESWPPSSLYDRFQPSDGYHVVPPLYTGTFIPPKPDLVFNTAPTAIETDHPAFTVQLSPTKHAQDLSHTNRPTSPIIEDWVSDSEDEYETKASQIVPSFVQSTEQVKSPRHSVQHVVTSIPADTIKPSSPKPTSNGKRMNRKACFVCKSVDHLIKDYDYHEKQMDKPTAKNHALRGNHKHYASMTHHNPQKHMVSAAVLTQSKLVSITAVRPAPVVSAAQGLQGRWERRPKCLILDHVSRTTSTSMTLKRFDYNDALGRSKSNMSYLSNYEELNGGYVAFGGNPEGGKIFRKGKIRTGKLDFDDVYFVKELKFNLFSFSQMCDKKNSVLFTNTACLVLPPDFKLPDESQVLLRVPRENNMYNVNLKNIVPSGDLTCLTYVACKKGKQHRASCMTKHVSSVDQPLFRLHMDLFGPTFVKSLNKKSYCLVVTDDYSRFTWVFFLATKDETSPILKTFITGLENQLSLKVKQNGIAERKNRTLIEAARTMLADSLLPIPFWAEVGKFDGKVDEGFLVGYSVNSSGPTWLFDIDSLTRTMNYQPVTIGNQTNTSAGFQDKFATEKAGEGIDQQYVLFPVWSFGSTNPQNTNGNAAFNRKEPDFDAKNPKSEVNVSPNSSAQSRKQDNKTKKEAKGKNPVESFTGYRDLSTEFKDCSDNSINKVNAAGTLVPTIRKISPNNTNTFSAAELEDITYSDDEDDVGAEVDFNNLETSISVSPIATSRVHKDHPKDPDGEDVDVHTYRSMIGLLMYLTSSRPYIMFACKKQTVVATSSTETEYVAAASCYAQAEGIDYEEVFAPVARIKAISQDKYVAEILRKFILQEEKSASTPIDTEKPLQKDPDGEDVDVHTYSARSKQLLPLHPQRLNM